MIDGALTIVRRALVAGVGSLGACCALHAGVADVSAADALRAATASVSVDRSGALTHPGLPVEALGDDRVVVLRASKENWRLMTAQVRATADGHIVAEKPITIHPLGTGGADSIVAMRARSDHEVVFAASNGELVIWNIADDTLKYLSNVKANRVVYGVAFLRNGTLLVHDSNAGGHFELWDIDAGRLLKEITRGDAFAVTTSGNFVVARKRAFDEIDAADFRVVRRWRRPDESITALVRLPDRRVLAQGYDGTLRVWNLPKSRARSAQAQLTVAPSDDDWNLHATFSADGYILTNKSTARRGPHACIGVCARGIWSGNVVGRIALPKSANGSEQRVTAFVPLDHRRVATIEADGTTKLWDLRSSHLLRDYPALLADYVEN